MRDTIDSAKLRMAVIAVPLGAFLSVAQEVVLARFLGVHGYGTYAAIYALVSTIVMLTSLGYPISLSRFVAELGSTSAQRDSGNGALSPLLWFTLSTGLISCLLVGWLVIRWYLTSTLDTSTEPRTLYYAVALLSVIFLSLWCRGVSIGQGRPIAAVFPREVFAPLIVMVACLSGVVTSVEDALLVAILSLLALHIHMPFRWLKRITFQDWKTKTSAGQLKQWCSTSLFLGVTSLASIGLFRWDLLVLGAQASSTEVAGYAAALKVAMAMVVVQRIVDVGATRQLVIAWQNRQANDFGKLVKTYLLFGVLLAAAATLAIALLGAQFLSIFGDFAVGFEPILHILLIGQFFLGATAVFDSMAAACGGHKQRAVLVTLASLIALGGQIVVVPAYGVYGAAICSALALVGMRGALAIMGLKRLRSLRSDSATRDLGSLAA